MQQFNKSQGGDPNLTGALNWAPILGNIMPTYDLRNTKTGEEISKLCSISEKESMVASGEWEQFHSRMPADVTHTGNIINKTSGDWKDLLKNIKKGAGGNSELTTAQKRKHGFVDNTIKT